MDKKEVIAFFDSAASAWDNDQVRNEEVIKLILDKGEIKKDMHILDVASGTGVLFPDYISRQTKVTGIDISPEMVKRAKEKFPQTEIICGDAQDYHFSNSFDAVMIYNAFPHFTDPHKLMENLYSCLKSGGRFTVAHGMSMKELEKCHSGRAERISLPLPAAQELAGMMSEFFAVDVIISDDRMYMVSGVKA